MFSQVMPDPVVSHVLSRYSLPETVLGAVPYGQGHINDTYCVVCQPREGDPVRFILQGINSRVFPDPQALMENFMGITSYLRQKITAAGGDPARETLALVPTRDGTPYHTDSQGKVWRLMPFVEGTDCPQLATPELFEASARAYGRFQYLLQDYPAHTLHETIADFHNTKRRFAAFCEAVQQDPVGRAKDAAREIQFVLDRESACSVAVDALARGELPLRVTHNDTKLNNILFDRRTGEGICIIDLDTTMPGLSIYDFGDSIRFGANHCREDETDLSKVRFDLSLYAAYTRGFLTGTQGCLTDQELAYLPWGARLMTLECGIRFLTDYLQGDRYFRVHRPGHNLDRARVQLRLLEDMENQFSQMTQLVDSLSRT